MGDKSKIQWTEATWNPVVGCTRVYNMWAHELRRRLGEPIGQGSFRVVFDDPEDPHAVIKLPLGPTGVYDNEMQLAHSGYVDDDGTAYARCWRHDALSDETRLLVLKMERVRTSLVKTPRWAWKIDCGQVGMTRDGRIVAYDI